MPVKEKHADFELGDDGWKGRIALRGRVGVKNCLPAFTAGRWGGEVEEESPGCFGGDRGLGVRGLEREIV